MRANVHRTVRAEFGVDTLMEAAVDARKLATLAIPDLDVRRDRPRRAREPYVGPGVGRPVEEPPIGSIEEILRNRNREGEVYRDWTFGRSGERDVEATRDGSEQKPPEDFIRMDTRLKEYVGQQILLGEFTPTSALGDPHCPHLELAEAGLEVYCRSCYAPIAHVVIRDLEPSTKAETKNRDYETVRFAQIDKDSGVQDDGVAFSSPYLLEREIRHRQ